MKDVLGAMRAPNWEQVFYVNPSVGDDAIGAMFYKMGRAANICTQCTMLVESKWWQKEHYQK